MDLQALGNIGEFVGAVGVIATLLYLARQIKNAQSVAQAQNLRGVNDGYRRIALLLAGDGDVAKIFRVGCQDREALSPIERTRFSHLMGELILHFLECKTARDQGLMEEEVYQRWKAYIAMMVKLPGAAAEWDYLQGLFKDDVVLALNEAREGLPDLDELNPGTWGPIPEPPPAAP